MRLAFNTNSHSLINKQSYRAFIENKFKHDIIKRGKILHREAVKSTTHPTLTKCTCFIYQITFEKL